MRELILAQGPARYLGGSIETFALPVGAFIAMLIFILLLVEGLVWAWSKGFLTWK